MRLTAKADRENASSAPRIDSFDKQVGQRVRLGRMMKGLTQQALATELGVTFQQVQKYENGSNRISAGKLQRIAESLVVPISFFFQSEASQTPNEQDRLTQLLEDRDAIVLLHAFAEVEDGNVRKAIVNLVRNLGGLRVTCDLTGF
jgi:transcriptional regulator with XRE-family HTH domain